MALFMYLDSTDTITELNVHLFVCLLARVWVMSGGGLRLDFEMCRPTALLLNTRETTSVCKSAHMRFGFVASLSLSIIELRLFSLTVGEIKVLTLLLILNQLKTSA